MKTRITRGSGFRGALDYDLDEGKKATGKKRPEIVDSNLPGVDARTFAAAFGAFRRLRPDIKRPVWHSSLRLPADERLSSARWSEVTAAYLAKMGFDEATGYVVIRHNDQPDGDHVHVILSRVNSRAEVWLGQHEVHRAIQATQELEREFGLTLTAGLGDADVEAKAARKPRVADVQSIVNASRVKGQPRIDTTEIARILLDCAARSHDLPTFTVAAAAAGIQVLPNRSKTTGYLSGLSVVPAGRAKAVALGGATKNKLTWGRLLKLWDQHAEAAEAAKRATRDAVAAADHRATQRVAVQLLDADRCADASGSAAPLSKPTALLSSAVHRETTVMNQQRRDAEGQRGFLSTAPPIPERTDDAQLVAADAQARGDKEARRKAEASAALKAELKSATRTQLQKLRQVLSGELRAADDEAIDRLLGSHDCYFEC